MPKVDNPNAIANSLPGMVARVKAITDDIKSGSRNAVFSIVVGLGGAIFNGAAQFLGGIFGNLSVTGAVAATGPVSGSAVSSSTTVTAGTDVNASGNVNASGSVTGANVFATSVFAANAGNIAGNITTARTQTWARNSDGYIGNTLSSLRFKTNISDSGIDPLAVLSIGVKHYNYIAEVRKRDDPTYEAYVGPTYHVALEVGAIAEDLHAAGLWEFVEYQREVVEMDGDRIEKLSLDAQGHPIPQSIHYGLWALAVLVAAQHVWSEHLKLAEKQTEDRADIDRILENLGI